MSLFARRKDKQIPKTPVTQDKALQNWLDSVGSTLQKYIFGGGNDRLITAQELIDSGIAGQGSGGFITSPPKNLTKPPKVSGLTANGAFASIFVQWSNPAFSNYGYTELWRADIDDIGMAVLIASTAVESYTDNVGSAATKYYWVRAVSDSGVKGDFNAAAGTKGETSLDPEYVKQLLTATKWQANTTYAPFQVVQPTVENGYQYVVFDGGQSGSVEPNWPTSVNAMVTDGGIEWRCLEPTERLPLIVGKLPDGSPAVFIDTAFIKNASITSAKIISLVADKIETGNLIADIQVKNKLWYGFNFPNGVFVDPDTLQTTVGKSGFYLGVDSVNSLPVLHLNTGIANGSRSLYFDGVQLKIENVDLVSSSDGEFDDLGVDSLTGNRAYATDLGFKNLFAVSDYVQLDGQGRPVIDVDTFDARKFFCWIYGCAKKVSIASPYALIGSGNRGGIRLQTTNHLGVVPYDYGSTTKYRMKKKAISLKIKIKSDFIVGLAPHISALRVFIFEDNNGFPLNFTNISQAEAQAGYSGAYLAKLDLSFTNTNYVNGAYEPVVYHFKNSSNINLFNASCVYGGTRTTRVYDAATGAFIDQTVPSGTELFITCESDNEQLNYSGNKRLKVGLEYEFYVNADGDNDDNESAHITLQFILEDKPLELNAINDSFD